MQGSAAGGVEAHVKGMAIMVVSVLMLPLMDAIGKWLAMMDNMPPATVTFMRFFVQCWLMFFILLVAGGGVAALRTQHLAGNLIRGVLMGFGGLCFFTAVKYMPLADAMAVFFAEPLILTLLSAIFLKEKVGWRRFSAVGIGLIGTMIVIQPSFEIFGAVSLLPLATAVTFAIYLILNRKFGAKESPLVMQFYAGVGGWVFAGLAMLVGPTMGLEDLSFGVPNGIQPWLLLLLLGTIGTVSHLMVVHAFKLAPASMLAPFQYLEIVNAVLVGLIVFGDFPTPSKWFGIVIIIGSGFYVFMRERKLKVEA
ncbi:MULTISPECIES: DMT family transporter [Brucella/Ochrobactrum group]|uniref:TRANSPORTER, DME FAMILY n=1 Tax=Ochrobactrum soli TaxID=2448455 RepID=A0A2P9HI19_9HYPH|nr:MULTISPECIES: DMT family transporter [Brucella]RRD24750.1 DMT family transporter [Brucellaceae bacterium VT-16-1752]WHT44072.1 DMT family transporter [Ochrobactrum sp. SSR]MDX4074556.1 DMT family transporter [Brucella sp. NBRC 113783]WHS32944.1 DMT family transporter [Brucella sp. NM4]SPL63430.1 TRANSPORTER, DME FAMILY [[Ochrobactrum] soli]